MLIPQLSTRLHARASTLAIFAAAVAFTALLAAPGVLAHGEQIKIGAGGGPVKLSAEQQKKLGLKLAIAVQAPVLETLDVNGELQGPPGAQAEASTRISGQVTALYVQLGDDVRAGQKLARVQSRLVGNPSPSVDILAPRAGRIDAVNVSLGQAVEPSTSLLRIAGQGQLDLVAHVYEEDLGKLRIGQSANVRLLSYPDQELRGQVRLIGPALDPLSRTVQAWIRLDNAQGLLRPNLFGHAKLELRRNSAALTVPESAVLEAGGERFVFVRQKGAFARVDVQTGVRSAGQVEIRSGLVPGDEVVTQGNREVYTLWLTGGALHDEDG